MPPALLFDISGIDLNHVLFGPEQIRKCNLQRGAMEHLNAIVWADPDQGHIIGYKDVGTDEFWVEGHIPGRPLLPGVIMIEAAAQLSSFYALTYMGWSGFLGFGGVEDAKFRLPVSPGVRMYLMGTLLWSRHRRICSRVQGVVDGNLAFECSVIGTQM